ncbi:MAG: DUF1801 domain-containing protein [Pseudomonadota bacterium]|nr:DUF1801 domain-containing protein [Pseudomonadota bacterium]
MQAGTKGKTRTRAKVAPKTKPQTVSKTAPKTKPKTVEGYIAAAAPQAQDRLREMLACLRKAAPKAEEALKWSSPALSYGTILFMFAAFKKHVSLYPTPSVIRAFENELKDYKTSSSTIQFPLDKPLPAKLIRRIADYRVTQVLEKGATWM